MMASSPASSERRANLIREMSRQSDRQSGHGSASSSSGSERNRMNDFDTASQELPAFPPQTPDHVPQQRNEPQFEINTSALKRAFPDFSEYGSTEPSEASVEMGRAQGGNSRRSLSPLGSDFSASISLDIGDGNKYKVTGTPPLKPRGSKNNLSKSNDAPPDVGSNPLASEQENQDPLKRANLARKNTNKTSSQTARRTIAELQPQVESEPSLTWNENKPTMGKSQKKNTRFGTGSIKQPLRENNSIANARPVQNTPQRGSANPTLQSSIAIPDMPNVTELVSGVRKDGTPLFSRGAKTLSALGTPSSVRQIRGKTNHENVNEVPVSELEKALYMSLQLLHEKVANLEEEKSQTVKKADEYELEVLQLRSKLEGQTGENQKDGGLGLDGAEERVQDWENEKMKFEQSIKTLQKRLDLANQKVSSSEDAVKNLTRDRDAANQQLAMAFVNSEELKQESQGVRNDIDHVKGQLMKMTKQYEKRLDKLMNQENELRKKVQRREKAVNEMSTLVKQLWETRTAMSASAPVSRNTSGRRVPSTARTVSQTDSQATMVNRKSQTSNKSTGTRSGESQDSARQHHHQRSHSDNLSRADVQGRPPTRRSNTEDVDFSASLSQVDFDGITDRDLTKDNTYGSFMDGDEVKKLQLILDQDKAKLAKHDISIPRTRPSTADKNASTGGQKGPLPRKSSLKDMNSQSKKNRVQYLDQEQNPQHSIRGGSSGNRSQSMRDDDPLSTEFQMEGSENGDTRRSVTSQRSERRRRSAPEPTENMTSALILPDITLTGDKANSRKPESGTDPGQTAKQTSKVKRPTPVTDRPQSEFQPSDTGNFTIRPARSPAVALAIVIQGLEEEVARLREKLAALEALYDQQKPALSKTKRKQVYDKMQKVLETIEHRCDQIYELYDVLEGQKASGQEMKDEEVEVTLQKVGLDINDFQGDIENHVQDDGHVGNKLKEFRQPHQPQLAAQNNGNATNKTGMDENTEDLNAAFWREQHQQPMNEFENKDHEFDDEGYDETEEVPWEGIEATQTQTLGSLSGVIGQQQSRFGAAPPMTAGAAR